MNVYQQMLTALETGVGVDTTEQAVLAALRAAGALAPDEAAHVEYGCLEHGVVHVNGEHRGWIEVDPANPTEIHFC